MHTAKCEMCEIEVKFESYRHHWPAGWTLTGRSRWGKKYHRRSGHGWWCPKCRFFQAQGKALRTWLLLLPKHLRLGLLAHLPGLEIIT
jgi:hypothetical protein